MDGKGSLDPYTVHDDGKAPLTRVIQQATMREVERTVDVTDGADSFAELLLPSHLLTALAAAGFTKPSPVQTTAIPLARVGADLIVQAKSGTGKTLVYGIPCVEKAVSEEALPQARACSLCTLCRGSNTMRTEGLDEVGRPHAAVFDSIHYGCAVSARNQLSQRVLYSRRSHPACCPLLPAAISILPAKEDRLCLCAGADPHADA